MKQRFQSVKEYQLTFLYLEKIFRSKGKGHFQMRESNRIYCQQACSERIAKGSYLDRREMILEGNLNNQKEGRAKKMVTTVDQFSPLEVFNVYLIGEYKNHSIV